MTMYVAAASVCSRKVWWITAIGFLKNIASAGILFWLPLFIGALLTGQVGSGFFQCKLKLPFEWDRAVGTCPSVGQNSETGQSVDVTFTEVISSI
jgi:hypothetical protein